MSQLTATFDFSTRTTDRGHRDVDADQLELLIDTITGEGRGALEGLSVAHVYNALAAQITAMGLRPAEQKLLRIAYWIAASPSA